MTFDECLQETIEKLGITEDSSAEDKFYCYMMATRGGVIELPVIEQSEIKEIKPRDYIRIRSNSEIHGK